MSRAVAFTHPRETPVVLERAIPEPGPGEVRVRIEACGLGGADFGFFQLDALPRTPLVPGLEAVGVVEASGGGVGVPVGARVGVVSLLSACGGCDCCERGLERWCKRAELHAWHRDGLLAEHVVTTERALVVLDDVEAAWAPLFASGWTAMSAVRASGIGAGLELGVLGVGGVGHLVVQIARAVGLSVKAFDVDPDRAALAAFGPARPPAVEVSPSRLEAESVDAVVVCTPSPQALQHAARAVRRGGRIVLAAASPSVRVDLSLFDTVMRGVSLVPAFLGARSELDELINLVREGSVVPVVERLSLEDVPKRFWALRDGGFRGRLVVTFGQ